jgi:hypothetical protein
MKSFCDNPDCQLHVMVNDGMHTMELERFGRTRIQATQYEYINPNGGRVVHLCSICHAAVELAKRGPKE